MSLFSELQNDILGDKPISSILRKANVLSYRLKNKEFKNWVEFELNGYDGVDAALVPDYRKFRAPICGDFIGITGQLQNASIPLSVFPPEIREKINFVVIRQGIKAIEALVEMADKSENGVFKLSLLPEIFPLLNNRVYRNMNCIDAWTPVSREEFIQILDTTRNRLLKFILELSDLYPDYAKTDFENSPSISDDQIHQVFNYYILGNNPSIAGAVSMNSKEGNMSVFDQRNQNVGYQFNAAGNINFDNVKNQADLVVELEKLKLEIIQAVQAKTVNDEIGTDVEYKLTKAIQQSRKPQPNKKTIIENINEAKVLLSGFSSAVGLVTALIKAAELASKFF